MARNSNLFSRRLLGPPFFENRGPECIYVNVWASKNVGVPRASDQKNLGTIWKILESAIPGPR